MSGLNQQKKRAQTTSDPVYIIVSVFIAFILDLQPWGDWSGIPDFLAVVILFWAVYQPRYMGMGVAFVLGLCMDINNLQVFGTQALVYTVLVFIASQLKDRMMWLSLVQQIPYVFAVLLGTQILSEAVQIVTLRRFPDPMFWIDSCTGAALWVIVSILLMIPRRQNDDNGLDGSL